MICLQTVEEYCKEYWKIENYQEAVNDTTRTWHCHHRYEIDYNLSALELQALGFYFNRPFYELIFLTPSEHKRLHHTGKPFQKNNQYYLLRSKDFHHTEETKQKMKGNQNSLKYHITAEELYDLYVGRDLSIYRIAALYECSWFCIYHKLKKYNIKK